jgi:glycerol-3-phosphate acyltransferase PlsY
MADKSVVDALLFIVAGFCSGSVLYCVYLPRVCKGVDVTKMSGDQNPGAYNAFVHAGIPLGVLCLFCELAKGYLPVVLSLKAIDPADPLFALVMLAPVAGHAFSPLRWFHGGKGIAVSFGVLLALAPKRRIVLVLAAAYLISLLLPLHPNEKRTVAAFSAFALAALLIGGALSVRLGCLLVALLVGWRNWADAKISLPLLRGGR